MSGQYSSVSKAIASKTTAGARSSVGKKPLKTTAAKKSSGSDKKLINDNEPKFSALAIENVHPPAHLNEMARQMWLHLAEHLCRERILTAVDIQNLEFYCVAYQHYKEAQQEIERDGVTLWSASGRCYKHPATTLTNETVKQMLVVGSLLGLDPVSRQRITASAEGRERNPFADLLS